MENIPLITGQQEGLRGSGPPVAQVTARLLPQVQGMTYAHDQKISTSPCTRNIDQTQNRRY